jgi:catechol 2,3-dioxygenase-like lactoylglutathione lyase family enzyme
MALVTGIDVPAVIVSDMDRSLAFYRDLLGLTVTDKKGVDTGWSDDEEQRWNAYHEKVCGIPGATIKVVFLAAPNGSQLELVEYVGAKTAGGPRRAFSEPGSAIIPFALNDSATTVAALREAGVDVIADPEPYLLDGVRSNTTYLYDPDGNALCLFEIVGNGD